MKLLTVIKAERKDRGGELKVSIEGRKNDGDDKKRSC